MKYIENINTLLVPRPNLPFKVLDLFAGCGGLSLGFEAVGFHTVGYEMDSKATETYNKNLKGQCFSQKLELDTKYQGDFDVVIGGPLPTF
jgi:DNA (cytosine-5)-methyltransferase 1